MLSFLHPHKGCQWDQAQVSNWDGPFGFCKLDNFGIQMWFWVRSTCFPGFFGNIANEIRVHILIEENFNYLSNFCLIIYSWLNMRQLHIFSVKPKHDKLLFVHFCVFPRSYQNLPVLPSKLFWTSKQNNFWNKTGKFR